MGRKIFIFLIIVLALFITGWFLIGKQTQQEDSKNTVVGEVVGKEFLVSLDDQNESGLSGTAQGKEVNGKVVISLELKSAKHVEGINPAHFHTGDCVQPGPIKYSLNDVVDGKSVTTLDVNMATFKQSLPLILNVHKSSQEIQTYIACGYLEK